MRSENKYFYELLMITFSNKKNQYDELTLRYKQMLNNNEIEMWGDFDKKIDMLIEELLCFLEITEDLNTIESLWSKNRQHAESTNQKIIELHNSSSQTVGFFNKKPKSEKIAEYKAELKETEELNFAYDTLLKILPQVIINSEMNTIKERKKVRYTDAIKTFSQRKVKSLEDCLHFWNCIHKDFEGIDVLKSQFTKLQL